MIANSFDGPHQKKHDMNPRKIILLLSLISWTAFASTPEVLPFHLRTIAQVETGNNPLQIGRDGERTRWQIRRTEWILWSSVPFQKADDMEGRRVAQSLLAGRINDFERRHGREPTPQQVYLLWHRPARVFSPTLAEKNRAIRFANLFALEVAAAKDTQPVAASPVRAKLAPRAPVSLASSTINQPKAISP